MALVPASSVPMKGPASSGTTNGISNQYCLVQAVDMDNKVAHVRSQLGGSLQVSLSVMIGKGLPYPAEGEVWLITSLFGDWMFVGMLNM